MASCPLTTLGCAVWVGRWGGGRWGEHDQLPSNSSPVPPLSIDASTRIPTAKPFFAAFAIHFSL